MEEHNLVNDMFKDSKHQRLVLAVIAIIQLFIIIGLIIGLIIVSMHSQDTIKDMAEENNCQMIELLTESELVTEYTIETDDHSLNNGYITVNKN